MNWIALMLVGYFGLTLLHTQAGASCVWVKLGDGGFLSFLDSKVRPSSLAYNPRSMATILLAQISFRKEFSQFWKQSMPKLLLEKDIYFVRDSVEFSRQIKRGAQNWYLRFTLVMLDWAKNISLINFCIRRHWQYWYGFIHAVSLCVHPHLHLDLQYNYAYSLCNVQ